MHLSFLDGNKIYNKTQEPRKLSQVTTDYVRVLSIGEFVAGYGAFSSTNTKLLHKGNVAFVVEDRLSSVLKQKDGSNVLKLAAMEANENTGNSCFWSING